MSTLLVQVGTDCYPSTKWQLLIFAGTASLLHGFTVMERLLAQCLSVWEIQVALLRKDKGR